MALKKVKYFQGEGAGKAVAAGLATSKSEIRGPKSEKGDRAPAGRGGAMEAGHYWVLGLH
jgi:hypothetical protein